MIRRGSTIFGQFDEISEAITPLNYLPAGRFPLFPKSFQKIKLLLPPQGKLARIVVLCIADRHRCAKKFPNAINVISVQRARDASILLINRRIDLFVHDSPSVVWQVSENEGVLKDYWEPFHEEFLGWTVKRGNSDLLASVNSILRKWKENGALKKVLTQWFLT